MCLGVPGRIEKTDTDSLGTRMATVHFGGVIKQVCVEFVPDVKPGDWVIVHAGFAISQLNQEEAAATFALLHEFGDFQKEPEDAVH